MGEKLWPVSVKGIIFNTRGEVLLLKNPRKEWELPGGRLEACETPVECLAREIREECGLAAIPRQALPPHVFEVIPGKHILLLPFICDLEAGGALTLSDEHSEAACFPPEAFGAIPLPRDYAVIIEAALKARLCR